MPRKPELRGFMGMMPAREAASRDCEEGVGWGCRKCC